MSNIQETEIDSPEVNGNVVNENKRTEWVKFDDEEKDPAVSNGKAVSSQPGPSANIGVPAVLNTESVQVNLERNDKNSEPLSPHKKNVEVINIHQGFSNGDIIVTLLPVNTNLPWITPAQFRPELVPEELMAQGLTLTVEEYVHAMELLVNDARFTLYNIFYKRVLVCWITIAFIVLLSLLFSGLTGLTLFSLGVVWLIFNALAIFVCMWIKLRLSKGLERCLASVNKLLIKHKLILALDDRGKLSCHKVHLCFLYFDSEPCISHIQQFIASEEGKTIIQGWEQKLDVQTNDIVIRGSQTTRLSRKQDMGEQVYLRYLQRWGKDFLRRRLDWTLDEEGGNPTAPRHLSRALCPCQYVEEILRNKEPKDTRACCMSCNNWLRRRGLD